MKVSSAEAMTAVIRSLGIVPFFKGPVRGFSIQEMTPPEHWFDSSDDLGPWDWKIAAVQSGDIAYGKFLCGGKAAFATVEWYAHLMNWRRSLPSCRPDEAGRKVLAMMERQGSVSSGEIRRLLGVKKTAADAVITKLSYQTRLLTGDIQRVYRGPELKYSGWQTCTFCSPEALFGAEDDTPVFGGFSPFSGGNPLETGCSPEESFSILLKHLHDIIPDASEKDLRRLLA
jgi:hypothetical protein